MAHVTPHVSDGILTFHSGTQERTISVGSADWWAWLEGEEYTSFHFSNQLGSFTARRERKHGGRYWYAYRKQQGKLHKAYLGKARELTPARLDAVAALLSEQASLRESASVETVAGSTHGGQSHGVHIPLQGPQPGASTSYAPGAQLQGLLLTTKLSLPPIRPDLVARPRLIEQLERGSQRKLTLIAAPAGFGKTTLLSAWQTVTRRAHAWLALDAGDNDPIRFWTYVLAALQTICPQLEGQVTPLLQSRPAPPIESLLTVLINVLATLTHDIALVLDDYHVITAQPIHDALTFLLEHLPPRLHIVLASRTEPPLPLIRLRAQGQLTELHSSGLRFTSTEVAAFLNQVMGLDLSHEEIATLDAHTEGWIVGLQLAALSLQGRQDVGDIIATFTGSHRYIMDYLAGEVLQRQPEHIRDFLLQTSILERLSESLCNAVTGRCDGQAMLEQLEQANLFLIPLDEQRHWYRYHHLFAEFLRSRLQQTHPELLPQLHLRATAWYRVHGLLSATIDHAFAAADMAYAAELMEQFAPIMLMRSEVTTFLNWVARLPEDAIRSRPRLRLYQAGCLITAGQLETTEAHLQEVERTLTDMQSRPGERDEAWLSKLEGEVFSVKTALAAFRGDVPHTIAFAQRALQCLPEEDVFTRGLIAASLGNAYTFNGDLAKANEAFTEAVTVGQLSQDYQIILSGIAAQGYLQAAHGHLHQSAETQREAIRLGTRQAGRMYAVVGIACTCLAELLCEWNELDEAERYAREGIELGRRWGYLGVVGTGYSVLAHVLQARGHTDEALALIQQGERHVREHSLTHITQLVTAFRAWIQLKAGDIKGAAQWAQARNLSADDFFTYPHELEHLILAQIYMAQGRYAEAGRLLERMLAATEADGRMLTAIRCMTLQAALLQLQGQLDQALAVLARPLDLAEAEGYIRSFLDYGEPIIILLRHAAARRIAPAYVRKLLLAAGATTPTLASHAERLLSEREISVLRSIAAGRSNQQIAQEHVIALSTVKTHLNNIYTRLGVHSRTQAIARAKELHLL
jgi:LuxR family maltose regulon positive regulatory protein